MSPSLSEALAKRGLQGLLELEYNYGQTVLRLAPFPQLGADISAV